jgi:hypothetical protein
VKVAILQSNYLPWKGYFDIIANVDLFIFHDDLQYTKNGWRNRNKIKTFNGTKWITVPCGTNERRLICDVKLINSDWQRKHWNLIKINYKNSIYFNLYSNFFEEIYLEQSWRYLSDLNQHIIKNISNNFLFIKTKFSDSRQYNLKKTKSDRVIELLKKVGATTYISGPSGKNYLNEKKFFEEEIKLEWMSYDGYPTYSQIYQPFEHNVSIIDLLFNVGPNAREYLLFNKRKLF